MWNQNEKLQMLNSQITESDFAVILGFILGAGNEC